MLVVTTQLHLRTFWGCLQASLISVDFPFLVADLSSLLLSSFQLALRKVTEEENYDPRVNYCKVYWSRGFFFFLTFRTTSTEFYKIPPLHLDGTYGLRSQFVFQWRQIRTLSVGTVLHFQKSLGYIILRNEVRTTWGLLSGILNSI